MAYSLKSVTIRTDNSESGMAKINELWADIMTGKIPLDFVKNGVPVKGLSPISAYAFFAKMEELVTQRKYIKIDESGETITDCANKAWSKVWQLTASGEIKRAFTIDYESTVPAEYTKDGKAHCYLYIAIK